MNYDVLYMANVESFGVKALRLHEDILPVARGGL